MRLELEKVEEECGSLREPERAALNVDRIAEGVWQMAQDFRRYFEQGDAGHRQRILRPFLRQITIDPDRKRAVVELFKVPVAEEMRERTGKLVPPTGFEPVSRT